MHFLEGTAVTLMDRLDAKSRRGSKPRCHVLTSGIPSEVAATLTRLIAPAAVVSNSDSWMPVGFEDIEEPQLHKAPRLLDAEKGNRLREWWLSPASRSGKTPNFDIAGTCVINSVRGLLLVEAKAHDEELHFERGGRKLKEGPADADRRASHDKIGEAIESAREGLASSTSLRWDISRDRCYQLSNRFAWAWKLTELGIPVVLVYLGFLRANEMRDRGEPLATHADWERLVLQHSRDVVPNDAWGRTFQCNGATITPLIRSIETFLPEQKPSEPRLVGRFEGGAVFVNEADGAFQVLIDEGTLNDLLAPEDQDDVDPRRTISFLTVEEREEYLSQRFSRKRNPD